MTTKEKGTNTLPYKESIMHGKVTAIEFAKGKLFPWDFAKIDAIEDELTQGLKKLMLKFRHSEIDLKIKCMDKVLDIIKQSNNQ